MFYQNLAIHNSVNSLKVFICFHSLNTWFSTF